MSIRLCDHVFYMFFTTGTISVRGWRLLRASCVIGLNGEMLAAFLADHSVGVSDDEFSALALDEWTSQAATNSAE